MEVFILKVVDVVVLLLSDILVWSSADLQRHCMKRLLPKKQPYFASSRNVA